MHTARSGMGAISAIAKASTWVGGFALLTCALLIGIDLILRKALGISMGGADEIAGYVLAITSAWALPVTLLKRAHIRVDILYTRLGLRPRVALDLFALACMLVLASTLAYHAWNVLWDSIEYRSVSNTPLQVPQWLPQSLWFAGDVFFAELDGHLHPPLAARPLARCQQTDRHQLGRGGHSAGALPR